MIKMDLFQDPEDNPDGILLITNTLMQLKNVPEKVEKTGMIQIYALKLLEVLNFKL